MKLRTRLSLLMVGVVVPQLVGMYVWDLVSRRSAASGALSAVVAERLAHPGERERCESDPAGWAEAFGPRGPLPGERPHGPHGPPPGGPPHGPGGPPRPPPLTFSVSAAGPDGLPPARLGGVDLAGTAAPLPGAVTLLDTGSWSEIVVLARAGWSGGPCEYVLVRGGTVPGFFGARLPADPWWLLPFVLTSVAPLLATTPLVHRLRRLASEVRQTQLHGYQGTIEATGDDEIADLARAFADAGRAVRSEMVAKQEREKALRDFVANTVHDVAIPLTVLQGHLDALHRGTAGEDTVRRAMGEAHYLGSLLRNLGAASRLDTVDGGVQLHPVALGPVVERVVARHTLVAGQRSVELHWAVPPEPVVVDGDVTLLEQAVSNLVHNAVRHHRPEGGHVAIVLEDHDRRFVLAVEDDGPGLDDEQLRRIHDRGWRSDAARTRSPEGLGLGMDIVGRVVERHGFALAVARSEHGGLRFELSGPTRDP